MKRILITIILTLALCSCGGNTPYELPQKVKNYITDYGFPVHGYTPEFLLLTTDFYLNGDQNHNGMVSSPHRVVFDYSFLYRPPSLQAKLAFHELIHRAQIEDLGWNLFIIAYMTQWFESGCSYERMKYRGFELEAYLYAQAFYNILMANIEK